MMDEFVNDFNLDGLINRELDEKEILGFLEKIIDERSKELGALHKSVIFYKAYRAMIVFSNGNHKSGLDELNNIFNICAQNYQSLSDVTLFVSQLLISCFRAMNDFDSIIEQRQNYVNTLEHNLGTINDNALLQKVALIEELRGIGRLDDALSITNLSIQQLLTSEEKQVDELLQLRLSRAVILSDLGEFDQAITEIKNVIDESISHFGEMADKTILYKYHLAQTLSDASSYHEAKKIAEEVLIGQADKLGSSHIDTFNTRELLANLLGETGKAEDAVSALETLIVDIETANETENVRRVDEQNQSQQLVRSLKSLGSTDRWAQLLSYAKGNLAYWLGKVGRNDEAIELYQQLLIDLESQFGADSPKVLTIRANLASCLKDNSDLQESRFMQEQVLADRIRILGTKHPSVFASRYNLIDTIAELGDLDEALELFAELIPEVEEALGKGHDLTLLAKHQHAYWLGEDERSDEEMELLQELFDQYREYKGNKESLDTRTKIAVAIEEAGDGLDAAPYYHQLIKDYENIYGSADGNTITMRRRFAYGLYWDEYLSAKLSALRELEIAFHYMESALGAFHEDTQLVKREIIGLYERLEGSYWEESSEESWHDNLRELTDRFPTDHPAIQRHKFALALCKFDQGKNQDALESLNQILLEQINQFGASDLRSVRTKEAIVKVLWSMDRKKEAIRLLVEVIDNQSASLGDTNSRTLRAKYELAELYISDNKFIEALPLLKVVVNFNAAQNQNNSSYDTQDWAGSSFFGSMPDQYDILYELASCYQKIGMSDKAISEIEKLINTLNRNDEMKNSFIYTKSRIARSEWKIELLSGEFGDSHLRVVDEELNLAKFKLEKPHLLKEAMQSLNDILEKLGSASDLDESKILEVLFLLVECAKRENEYEKVKELLTRTQKIQAEKYGKSSQHVLNTTKEIIEISISLKEFKYALDQLELFLSLDENRAFFSDFVECLIHELHMKCKTAQIRDDATALQIDHILIPQDRIAEAMMWCRSLVSSADRFNYANKINSLIISTEIIPSYEQDNWKKINIDEPLTAESSQQSFYNKITKLLSQSNLPVSRDSLSSWPGPSFSSVCHEVKTKFLTADFQYCDHETITMAIFDYINFVMENPLGSEERIPIIDEPYKNLAKEDLLPLVNKNDPWALKQYGLMLDKAGNRDEAVKFWERAASLGNPAAMRNLGVAALNRGEAELAVELILKAIELGSTSSHLVLGHAYAEVNENLVEQAYRKGVEHLDLSCMFNLANRLENQNREDEAILYYRMASEFGHKVAMIQLSDRLQAQKRYDESLVWLERAEDDPDPDTLNNISILRNILVEHLD